MWRNVLESKYDYSKNDWLPLLPISSIGSKIWKDIINIPQKEVLLKGLEIFTENGKLISFWCDMWVGNSPLREKFPRLFRASLLPNASVADMGSFVNNEWIWEIRFRRGLFEWDKDSFENMLICINQVKICHNKEDRLVWKEDSKGVFLSRSFYNFCLIRMELN